MRGIFRWLEGLANNDLTAWMVLAFAVVGTAIIFFVTEMIQKNSKRKK